MKVNVDNAGLGGYWAHVPHIVDSLGSCGEECSPLFRNDVPGMRIMSIRRLRIDTGGER